MLLGFQRRFEPFVLDGSKRHTIRAIGGRRPFRIGDICDCYVNPRRKSMRLLGRWPCVKVEVITIAQVRNGPRAPVEVEIAISGSRLEADELNALAWRDGFRDRGRDGAFQSMVEFWQGRLPFKGQIIHWDYDHPVQLLKRKRKPGNLGKTRPMAQPVARSFKH